MFETIKTYQLNWNAITVEGYSELKNEAIMVFNCDITTDEKSNNVINYVVGRTAWCCQNLPKNIKIKLSFDIRGQGVILTEFNIFKDQVLALINNLPITNLVIIDVLI
jgi:hypothetical protein